MAREDEQHRKTPDRGSERDATHKGAFDPAEIGAVRLNPLTAPGQYAAAEPPERPEDARQSNRSTRE